MAPKEEISRASRSAACRILPDLLGGAPTRRDKSGGVALSSGFPLHDDLRDSLSDGPGDHSRRGPLLPRRTWPLRCNGPRRGISARYCGDMVSRDRALPEPTRWPTHHDEQSRGRRPARAAGPLLPPGTRPNPSGRPHRAEPDPVPAPERIRGSSFEASEAKGVPSGTPGSMPSPTSGDRSQDRAVGKVETHSQGYHFARP